MEDLLYLWDVLQGIRHTQKTVENDFVDLFRTLDEGLQNLEIALLSLPQVLNQLVTPFRDGDCDLDQLADIQIEGFFGMGESFGGILLGDDLNSGQEPDDQVVLLLDGLL